MLDRGPATPPETSVGDLFGRLAEDGKSFVRAEADLYKAIAKRRVSIAAPGAVALVAAVFLANAALVTLIVLLAIELAGLIGAALAGIATFVLVCAIAGGLAWWGTGKLKALGGDAEERAALAATERRP